ncbi:unnamed protein product [Prunus armeniaca]
MTQQDAQASPDVIIGLHILLLHLTHNVDVRLTALREELSISVPTGDIFMVGAVYRDSLVLVGDIFLEANLIPLDIVDLDVILGMDWLAKHHGSSSSILPHFSHDGETLEDIPVVWEFPDVFLEDLLGLPLEREIEFTIELVL